MMIFEIKLRGVVGLIEGGGNSGIILAQREFQAIAILVASFCSVRDNYGMKDMDRQSPGIDSVLGDPVASCTGRLL